MRIKSSDGPINLNNGNDSHHDLLNSPKRLNTVQNSRIAPATRPSSFLHHLSNVNSNNKPTIFSEDNNTTSTTCNRIFSSIGDVQENATAGLTEVLDQRILQWYSDHPGIIGNNVIQERIKNINNLQRQQHHNINNNVLDITPGDYVTPSSTCSESPDYSSFVDYEEHQNFSSSPLEEIKQKDRETEEDEQEEEETISVSESFSGSNFSIHAEVELQRGGIVNPNYPGFQDYAVDLEFYNNDYDKIEEDDDGNGEIAECQSVNNNNVEAKSVSNEKEKSLNCLNTNESLQKIFYEKEVFNIPPEDVTETKLESDEIRFQKANIVEIDGRFASKRNVPLLNDSIENNETKSFSRSGLIRSETFTCDKGTLLEEKKSKSPENHQSKSPPDGIELTSLINQSFAFLEKSDNVSVTSTDNELQEAVRKLSVCENIQPSAAVCSILPNTGEPFIKCNNISINSDQSSKMATMSIIRQTSNENFTQDSKSKDSTLRRNTMEFIPNKVTITDTYKTKLTDAFLSKTSDKIPEIPDFTSTLPNYNANNNETIMEVDIPWIKKGLDLRCENHPSFFRHESDARKEELVYHLGMNTKTVRFPTDLFENIHQKEEESVVPRKKEKMELSKKIKRDHNQQFGSLITVSKRDSSNKTRENLNRRSIPNSRERKKASADNLGNFDVYNIETAMPTIDLEAIESHLRAAREEERRRRTDREEIRRRLAMGAEEDYFCDRPGKKPSLQARLQSGMNLQICFMNENVSDTESPSSDSECPVTNSKEMKNNSSLTKSPTLLSNNSVQAVRPVTLAITESQLSSSTPTSQDSHHSEGDFFTRQAKLQTEARMALAQAKEMARMQMELERQHQVKSPITEMVRNSLEKVGIPFPEEKRRLSRQILTEMNIAQLQVIVNDLHTQIETLNENLVKFLMERDDLHMEQDSMLVDIEDLTRYLGAKEQTLREQNTLASQNSQGTSPPSPAPPSPPRSPLAALNSVKPHLHRIANFVKK